MCRRSEDFEEAFCSRWVCLKMEDWPPKMSILIGNMDFWAPYFQTNLDNPIILDTGPWRHPICLGCKTQHICTCWIMSRPPNNFCMLGPFPPLMQSPRRLRSWRYALTLDVSFSGLVGQLWAMASMLVITKEDWRLLQSQGSPMW
jgi:hypothetical protein